MKQHIYILSSILLVVLVLIACGTTDTSTKNKVDTIQQIVSKVDSTNVADDLADSLFLEAAKDYVDNTDAEILQTVDSIQSLVNDASIAISDSNSIPDSIAVSDSSKVAVDADADILENLDSLAAKYARGERGIQWNDSLAARQDSLKKSSTSPLEDPVVYTAKDSVVFTIDDKNAYLFGDGNVKYMRIDLASEQIRMNMDSSTVHAIGVKDSLGVLQGTPIFKDGSDEYQCETMSYNFKSKKAYIRNVYTEQQDGFLRSKESKKGGEDEFYMKNGTYTTCDEEHPHFYIAMSRAKVHTGKNIFSGPAWLVVEDVPLPLAIPFAYFPFTSSYSSGFIMPSYGDESTRGFYLRDGGYYFAISDNLDLKLTGEIYTKGSWGVSAQTTYTKRYKFRGNFYFNYQVTKTGEKNLPDYNVVKNFKLQWSHSQDSKASLNSSFSASINFATQSYEKNNLTSLYNPTSYSQSTRTSSISYSRQFPKLGLSISSSFNIAQNMKDSTLSLTLPSLSISLSRVYPFKRKHAAGKERWYEKIALTYTGTLSNSINTKEDQIFKKNIIKDWNNGMKHSIPINASFTILKYINITPSINYNARWYTHKIEQSWDQEKQQVKRDTIYGFNHVHDFNFSISANTKIYGFYTPSRKIFGDKIDRIRHVMTPSVSFSYAPDFGDPKWGYWKRYEKIDAEGNVTYSDPYSPYTGMMYGVPGQGKTGTVNFDLSNNIEMKVNDTKSDSVKTKKVSIIDELGASIGYNLAAKRQPWSNLSTKLRLKWGKTTFNINAVFNTYAYEFDKNGNVITSDRTEWSYGRFGRFQGISKNLSYTFNNNSIKDIKKKIRKLLGKEDEDENSKGSKGKNGSDDDDDDDDDEETTSTSSRSSGKQKNSSDSGDSGKLDADGYMKFAMPWSFSISYGITMAEDRSAQINVKNMRYPYKFTQNMNFSGNVKLSSDWNVNFSSGWDFNYKKLSMTTVSITRDMHCFNIAASFVFGTFTSYNVTLRANASTLTDALKYDKKSSYNSSINWY